MGVVFRRNLYRTINQFPLTTNGHHAYLDSVDSAFMGDIDYAMLVKTYRTPPEGERRYTPPVCIGAERKVIRGNPDPEAFQYELCGTGEPHDADAQAPLHAPDQCVLKEIRKSLSHGRALRALVQLHPHSQDAEITPATNRALWIVYSRSRTYLESWNGKRTERKIGTLGSPLVSACLPGVPLAPVGG